MKKTLFILMLCSLITSACGQTGPLVLPDKDRATLEESNSLIADKTNTEELQDLDSSKEKRP